MLLIGQQVLRFHVLPQSERTLGAAVDGGVNVFGSPEVRRLARLTRQTIEGVGRDVYDLYRNSTVLGREAGDIVFTDDRFLSRQHAVIELDEDGSGRLTDLESSNGTFIRIRGEARLNDGDEFRVGTQLLRFSARRR